MPLKIMKFYKIFSDISYMQLLLMNNHENSSNTNKSRQYSFTQRLQNWTLQQRERTSGMRDVVSLLISMMNSLLSFYPYYKTPIICEYFQSFSYYTCWFFRSLVLILCMPIFNKGSSSSSYLIIAYHEKLFNSLKMT